jgi:hypothetical protein
MRGVSRSAAANTPKRKLARDFSAAAPLQGRGVGHD